MHRRALWNLHKGIMVLLLPVITDHYCHRNWATARERLLGLLCQRRLTDTPSLLPRFRQTQAPGVLPTLASLSQASGTTAPFPTPHAQRYPRGPPVSAPVGASVLREQRVAAGAARVHKHSLDAAVADEL